MRLIYILFKRSLRNESGWHEDRACGDGGDVDKGGRVNTDTVKNIKAGNHDLDPKGIRVNAVCPGAKLTTVSLSKS